MEDKALTEAHRRGAALTNSGKSPIAGLPEEERKQLLAYVIQRSLEDKRLKDVAEEMGLHRSALNQALLKYCPEDWQEAQAARALVNVEDCEEELETAQDMLAVARARERLRSAQWQLERVCRRIYGTDSPPNQGQGVIQINIGITRPESVNISASQPDSGQLQQD